MKLTADSAACVFAAAFYEAAAIKFTSNPLLGYHGLLMTNTAHNMVHLLIVRTVWAVRLKAILVIFGRKRNHPARPSAGSRVGFTKCRRLPRNSVDVVAAGTRMDLSHSISVSPKSRGHMQFRPRSGDFLEHGMRFAFALP